MTKKITAIFLALCMAISVLPMTIQAASKPDIKVGDYVKMGAYNNASILWRCVSIDNNGPLMLADKIVDTLAYDAKTNDNSNSKSHSRSYKRDDYGSNYWKDSNMRSWLNSTAAEGKVDWLCGNPPKDGYVSGVGAYNEKAGFLNAFSKSEIAAMKTVTQRSLVSHPEYNKGIVDGDANSDLLYYTDISEAVANYDSSYFETTTEKVFLLDVKQANAVWKNLKGYYVAYNNDGMAWPYWLRTPVTDCNHDMRYISSSGQVGRYAPWYSDLGVRPAFYLDSEYFVTTSGSGSQSSPYIGSAPISKRMIIQFRNLPRTQIPIGMSAPSKAFSSPSARGIQMTENILILPSLFIPSKKHVATRKIWLLSFAARDTQKVSRANSSMMSNDFGRTL